MIPDKHQGGCMTDYSGANENDLKSEIALAQIGIAREQKRLATAIEALALLKLKSSNDGEPKPINEVSDTGAPT